MEYVRKDKHILIRLDTGEKLVESIVLVATREKIDCALITSGVGLLEGVEFGWFCADDDHYDYEPCRIAGFYDLSAVSGNIAMFDGELRAHVHIVANRPDFSTISGHLIEAKAHVTIEIGLCLIEGTDWHRIAKTGCPATFLTRRT